MWVLSGLFITIQPLCGIVSYNEFHRSQLHVWLLVYLTKTCFNNVSRHQGKKIFKWDYISTINQISVKVNGKNYVILWKTFRDNIMSIREWTSKGSLALGINKQKKQERNEWLKDLEKREENISIKGLIQISN